MEHKEKEVSKCCEKCKFTNFPTNERCSGVFCVCHSKVVEGKVNIVNKTDLNPFVPSKVKANCIYKNEDCEVCPKVKEEKKEWEKEFDDPHGEFGEYSGNCVREMIGKERVKKFIRQTLQAQKEKILEIAEKEKCSIDHTKLIFRDVPMFCKTKNSILSDLQDRVRKI